jgi:hypothetical protein
LPGEEEFARLADEIPGFAGTYFDQEGNLVVALTDAKQADRARVVLEPTLSILTARVSHPRRRGGLRPQLRIRQVQYDFQKLREWRDRLTPNIMALKGVQLLDLDEVTNRVWVGIVDASARGEVMRQAANLAIPAGALTVEMTQPICPMQSSSCDPCEVDRSSCEAETEPDEEGGPYETEPPAEDSSCPEGVSCSIAPAPATLSSEHRPVPGGVQLYMTHEGRRLGTCTLGWNTVYNGAPAFVTNSHCTAQRGNRDNTLFYQPWPFNHLYIGNEVLDPPNNIHRDIYTGKYCPFFSQCRYSDAAVVAYRSSSLPIRAAIARTMNYNGSKNINQSNPYFWINSTTLSQPPENAHFQLDKVGFRTGWTWGEVTRTCVHASTGYGSYVMFCQNYVVQPFTSEIANKGDSGSPVFRWDFGNSAVLHGILWGGGGTNNSRFVYSPLRNVYRDLGNVTPLY